MEKLKPDVLAVQEVEPLDGVLLFAGETQPTFRDRVADPAYPRRAIGVFSYTDTQLEPVDVADPLYCFRRYEASRGDLAFNVVGVWTAATDVSEISYMQAIEGLRAHQAWIRERPTVILGDFNDNASYRTTNMPELLTLMESLGLVSAYHHHSSEEFGKETRPTHFHHGKVESSWHLDYVFLPEAWVPHIQMVEVGRHEDWHHVSDHVPLIVDLDL